MLFLFWLMDGNFLLDVLITMSVAMYMNMMNESFKEKNFINQVISSGMARKPSAYLGFCFHI